MMKLGIVGLPNVGKTTLFNALTHAHAAATAYAFSSADPNVGVVAVPDERLWRLHEVLQTPKAVPATIEVVDIPGLADGASRGEGLGNAFLAAIRGVDAVVHVVRGFENADVAHVRPQIDPLADVELVETELVLSDHDIVERRAAKTGKAARAGDPTARKEMKVLEPLLESLESGRASRFLERDEQAQPVLRELGLVTERPVLYVINIGDDEAAADRPLAPYEELVDWAGERGDRVIALPARLEAELGELEQDEAAEFRAEMGVPEGGVDDLIRASYDLLGYLTFFTGDYKSSETRAWQLLRGSTARQAAGRIHSDIERGFVRVEVVPLDALLDAGSFQTAKERGTLRIEGKEYEVRDADVLHFRHTA